MPARTLAAERGFVSTPRRWFVSRRKAATIGAVPYDIVDLVERPDRDFEEFFDPAEFETRAWLEDQHYWHLYRRTVVLDVLRAAGVGSAEALIELGCGAGTVTTFLNQNGLRVDYSDVHAEALRFAVERAQTRLDPAAPVPRFLRADITRDLPPGGYDGILLLDADQRFRREGLPAEESMIRAGERRLRPIMMTALATVASAVIMIGRSRRSPARIMLSSGDRPSARNR